MGESLVQRQTVVVYARHMLTFNLLDDWLPRLQHPAVRDLAWTLLAAPLLADTPCPQRHPLAASSWAQYPERLADWLYDQDQQPATLLEWLNTARSQRLGIYYERLWHFALLEAPDIEVLGVNIPVRKGAQTLGELDLLLRDAEGTHHFELAIKLYLGPAEGDGRLHINWRGAGRADNLERKLSHLSEKQLPLARTPEAQLILNTLAASEAHSELWLSGCLFYPWPAGCESPTGGHPATQHAHWLHRRHWQTFCATSAARFWQPVPGNCRLAPIRFAAAHHSNNEQPEDWLRALPVHPTPTLVAGFAAMADGSWREAQRVMLLDDEWPVGLAG